MMGKAVYLLPQGLILGLHHHWLITKLPSHLASLAADLPEYLSPTLVYHGSSLLPTFIFPRVLSAAGTAQEALYDLAPT